MIFGGKCALIPDQLEMLASKGCKNFEVHMFYKNADSSKVNQVEQLIKNSGMSCYCLHSPYEDSDKLKLHLGMLGEIEQKETLYSLKETLIMADQLNIPNVVAHLGGYTKKKYNPLEFKKASVASEELAYRQIEEVARFIDNNNLKPNLCIENIMCYGDFPGDMACFGTRLDANNFVLQVNHPNVKTTLDTCHMMLDVNIDCLAEKGKPIRIADYIKVYSDTIGLVHLNNFAGFGLYKEHSIPFTEEDRDLLKKILIAFKKSNYSCPITNEVNEPGYTSDVAYTNYEAQINQIKEIAKEIGLEVEV